MNHEKFAPLLGDWSEKLRPFIESKECDEIYAKLKEDAARGKLICPNSKDVFRAFSETPYKKLSVVFLLQDPYPWINVDKETGKKTCIADGIAMSCRNTGKLQPSLEKFYEGILDDLKDEVTKHAVLDPDLTTLCFQGVMMLNTALTVEEGKIGSHHELWKPFMKYVFEEIFSKCNNGLIFVLCGKESQKLEKFIFPHQHYIFKLEHPAAAAHAERKWDHQNIFSKINKLLKENNGSKYGISWLDDLPF